MSSSGKANRSSSTVTTFWKPSLQQDQGSKATQFWDDAFIETSGDKRAEPNSVQTMAGREAGRQLSYIPQAPSAGWDCIDRADACNTSATPWYPLGHIPGTRLYLHQQDPENKRPKPLCVLRELMPHAGPFKLVLMSNMT